MNYIMKTHLCLINSCKRNVLNAGEGSRPPAENILILPLSVNNSLILFSSNVTKPINSLIKSIFLSPTFRYLKVKLVRTLMKNLVAWILNFFFSSGPLKIRKRLTESI